MYNYPYDKDKSSFKYKAKRTLRKIKSMLLCQSCFKDESHEDNHRMNQMLVNYRIQNHQQASSSVIFSKNYSKSHMSEINVSFSNHFDQSKYRQIQSECSNSKHRSWSIPKQRSHDHISRNKTADGAFFVHPHLTLLDKFYLNQIREHKQWQTFNENEETDLPIFDDNN